MFNVKMRLGASGSCLTTPNYSEGRNQENPGSKPSLNKYFKYFERPYLKKKKEKPKTKNFHKKG
jgi:hypothetical protein